MISARSCLGILLDILQRLRRGRPSARLDRPPDRLLTGAQSEITNIASGAGSWMPAPHRLHSTSSTAPAKPYRGRVGGVLLFVVDQHLLCSGSEPAAPAVTVRRSDIGLSWMDGIASKYSTERRADLSAYLLCACSLPRLAKSQGAIQSELNQRLWASVASGLTA